MVLEVIKVMFLKTGPLEKYVGRKDQFDVTILDELPQTRILLNHCTYKNHERLCKTNI